MFRSEFGPVMDLSYLLTYKRINMQVYVTLFSILNNRST